MILIAASLYLPQHIHFIINRAWFYWHGDDASFGNSTIGAGKDVVQNTSTLMADMAKETIENLGKSLRDVGSGGDEL